MDIFLGRQPILNRNGDIYGYELLYRNSEVNKFPNIRPERATATVIVNAFLSMGIDQVTQNRLCFINFNENLLNQDFITTLNPRQVVIEILEDVVFSERLIQRLKELREMGFRIALDDFVLDDGMDYGELFNIVQIIKVDFMNTTVVQRRQVEQLAQRYPSIALLAEKIETEAEYTAAEKLGYRLFQGYFFAKPEIIKSSDIPSNFTLYFHIMSKIQTGTSDVEEISELVMRDVSLSYKLLKYINSLAFEVPNQISSIRQAIMLMGTDTARKWMQVLLLHDMGDGPGKGRTKALIDSSLERARLCELLAKRKNIQNTDKYFLVGMFSLMDAIMQRSWEDLLPHLPLAEIVKQTVQGKQTKITPYLKLAEAMEGFRLNEVYTLAKELEIPTTELSGYSIEVQRWIHEFDLAIQ